MDGLDLNQPASVHWGESGPSDARGGEPQQFDSVWAAIEFTMHEVRPADRASLRIETAARALTMSEIQPLYLDLVSS